MKKILVSACLFGWHCRYDAEDLPSTDERFLKWKAEGRLIPVCPEIFGGLDTPRPDAQRLGEKVITCEGTDVTRAYDMGGEEAVRLAKAYDVAFCIMKQDSPSCGSKFVFDGTHTDTKIEGQGTTVERLRNAGYLVLDEDEIDKAEELLKDE